MGWVYMGLTNGETQLLLSVLKLILVILLVLFLGVLIFTGGNLWKTVSPDARLIFLGLIYIGIVK